MSKPKPFGIIIENIPVNIDLVGTYDKCVSDLDTAITLSGFGNARRSIEIGADESVKKELLDLAKKSGGMWRKIMPKTP